MTGILPRTGGRITGVVVADVAGGRMTPLRELPPGTSAPRARGAGTAVCGPEASGAAGTVCVCAKAGEAASVAAKAARA
jgi:hypothetical protein